MTPEAVLYRYLQVIGEPQTDTDSLVALLCADADLLGRWLTMLRIPVDHETLAGRVADLDQGQIRSLAEAQGWAELTMVASTRLSITQWLTALKGALLAQKIAEYMAEAEIPAFRSSQDPRNVRLRALLALSGIHLTSDERLAQMNEFRGANPALLEDASIELRIFAVVDGSQVGRGQDLAWMLLKLDAEPFQDMMEAADRDAAELIAALGIEQSEEIDWSYRIWVRQQMQAAATAFAECRSWQDFARVHEQVSGTIFSQPPALLYQQSPDSPLFLLGNSEIAIALQSATSGVAAAARSERVISLYDRPDTAVVDRQLLRMLHAEEADAVPIAAQERASVLVVPQDEERDTLAAAEIYAKELSHHLLRVGGRPESQPIADDGGQLELFRANEHKRLREIVHEANNPLSIVHNYLHILELRLQHEPEAVQQLELISSELRRAGEIISRARNIPQEPLEPQVAAIGAERELELTEWLGDLVQLHRGLARSRGVALDLDVPPQSVKISTHPDALAQILGNLLKNAIEACEQGDTVTAGLRTDVYRDGRFGVDLLISDTGPGLPPEVYEHIAEAKRSSKGGDHQGIGLQVAYRLANEIDGFIDVSSTRGLGTDFTIFLPLAPRS